MWGRRPDGTPKKFRGHEAWKNFIDWDSPVSYATIATSTARRETAGCTARPPPRATENSIFFVIRIGGIGPVGPIFYLAV